MRGTMSLGMSLLLLCTEARAGRPETPGILAPLPREVTAYEHVGFEGAGLPIRGDIPDLRAPAYQFNDIISSIRLSRGVISVYEHVGYQGRCQTLRESVLDLRGSTVGNDAISSIRLGRECATRKTARTALNPGLGNETVQGADHSPPPPADEQERDAEFRCGLVRRRTGSETPPPQLSCERPETATCRAHCVLLPDGSATERTMRAVRSLGRCVMPKLVLLPGERELLPGTKESREACGERVCAPCAVPTSGSPAGGCPCMVRPFYPWAR